MSDLVVECQGLTRVYGDEAVPVRALQGVDLSVTKGDWTALAGPSGSGKSTLLHLVGGLDRPTSGTVTVDGEPLNDLSESQLSDLRLRKVGFVFQDHLLLPQCTVLENVLVPTLVGKPGTDVAGRARTLLEQVGLRDRLDHRPAELSGGERQRVALARALIRNPPLVVCDEPTGNLDRGSAETITSLLFELHEQQSNVLLIVTHNPELANRCPIRYRLDDRQLALASA